MDRRRRRSAPSGSPWLAGRRPSTPSRSARHQPEAYQRTALLAGALLPAAARGGPGPTALRRGLGGADGLSSRKCRPPTHDSTSRERTSTARGRRGFRDALPRGRRRDQRSPAPASVAPTGPRDGWVVLEESGSRRATRSCRTAGSRPNRRPGARCWSPPGPTTTSPAACTRSSAAPRPAHRRPALGRGRRQEQEQSRRYVARGGRERAQAGLEALTGPRRPGRWRRRDLLPSDGYFL